MTKLCCEPELKDADKWYWTTEYPLESEGYFFCPRCNRIFRCGSKVYIEVLKNVKQVTPNNYVGIYCAWCAKNSFAPLRFDILQEVFYGCESNNDYKDTLDALYEIQSLGLRLSFMDTRDKNKANLVETLLVRLKIRLELFKRVPSATNMLLAYNLIEEITLKCFSEGKDITDEVNKNIERFDKLKSLALGTKYINERTLAFNRSVDTFKKLTQVNL